jgi:hypothetical protein
MHSLKIILVSLLLAAISGPLLAYTIYLKGGSRLIAREVYRVQDGKAIITLQNGTQTFIDVSEIDIERTLNANRAGYGTALMVDEGKVIEGPIVREDQKEESLVDLAARGETRARNRPQARRPLAENDSGRRVTAAGFIDLGAITRRPYSNMEISSEIRRVFLGQGVDAVQIHQGTQPNSPFLEITTGFRFPRSRGLRRRSCPHPHTVSRLGGGLRGLPDHLIAQPGRSIPTHRRCGQRSRRGPHQRL